MPVAAAGSTLVKVGDPLSSRDSEGDAQVSPETAEVLAHVEGGSASSLNRPRAINSLTHTMVGVIDAALERWTMDDAFAPSSSPVPASADSAPAGCGGDLPQRAADGAEARQFWFDEYA